MTKEEFSLNVKRERGRLMAAARRLARHGEDAEDLLQTTLLRAFRYKDRYDAKRCTFYGWCLVQMKHIFWEECRRSRRALSYNDERGSGLSPALACSGVEEVLSHLNERERGILTDLCHGYSARETAARWKVSRHYIQRLKLSARAIAKVYL